MQPLETLAHIARLHRQEHPQPVGLETDAHLAQGTMSGNLQNLPQPVFGILHDHAGPVLTRLTHMRRESRWGSCGNRSSRGLGRLLDHR